MSFFRKQRTILAHDVFSWNVDDQKLTQLQEVKEKDILDFESCACSTCQWVKNVTYAPVLAHNVFTVNFETNEVEIDVTVPFEQVDFNSHSCDVCKFAKAIVVRAGLIS